MWKTGFKGTRQFSDFAPFGLGGSSRARISANELRKLIQIDIAAGDDCHYFSRASAPTEGGDPLTRG